jgi:threonine/homoserine/homoserine lactone efflux protein
MTLSALLAFIGLCVILAVTPGPDTFLVLRYSMVSVRNGLAASVGSSAGGFVWAALVGVGIAALLEQSAEAFRIVKIAGGVYLLYLAFRAFWDTRAQRTEPISAVDAPATLSPLAVGPASRTRSGFFAGLLSCSLNPKVGLFFLAVVPQFLPATGSIWGAVMLLAAIDFTVSFLYLGTLSFVAAKAVAWLNRPRVTLALERTSASILALLGLGTIGSALIPDA